MPQVTEAIHQGREIAIDRIKREADVLGAEDVVGVKTYIQDVGSGLVEFMAIGTAIKQTSGMATSSQARPWPQGFRKCGRRRVRDLPSSRVIAPGYW